MPRTKNKVDWERRPKRYPWESWFKKDRFTLVQDKDFMCQVHSMAQQVRSYAYKNEIPISISVNDDRITVTRTVPYGDLA